MAFSFNTLVSPGVGALTPYIPGRPPPALQKTFALHRARALASNENVLGASRRAMRVARRAVRDVHLYPDGGAHDLRDALAAHYAIDVERILVGNGSNDVLVLLAQSFLSERTSAVYSKHAFVVYALATQMCGATPLVAQAHLWGHDLKAMLKLVREDTRIVFVANPNNPTGTWVSGDALRDFMRALPAEVLVVVDEAYYEYVNVSDYPHSLTLQREFPNLIITRTFSKIYGLAGLRVGYCIADPEIVAILNRVRQPFNVNHVAQKAAMAALGDSAHVRRSYKMNNAGLMQLSKGLNALGVEVLPSVANFVCFKVPDLLKEDELYSSLLSRGIIIRSVAKVYDMPGYMRVTVGTRSDNSAFLNALGQCIKHAL